MTLSGCHRKLLCLRTQLGLPRALRRTRRFLRRTDHWTSSQIRAYQTEELKRIVNDAFNHCPGYRESFFRAGLAPEQIATLEDIRKLPFLVKNDLRERPGAYRSSLYSPADQQPVTSGGTTGIPTQFHHLRRYNDEVFQAYKYEMFARAGYRLGNRILDLTATFKDRRTLLIPQENRLYVSLPFLSTEYFDSYLDEITAFDPRYVVGYPSTVSILAKLCNARKLELSLNAVFLSSEVLYPEQADHIRREWRCRLFQWYGMSEGAGYASGCEKSDLFHFFPQAGIVEILREDGTPASSGEEGEIVLTGFHTKVTPFIRYRTGDRALVGPETCPECHRNHSTVATILGRTQEYLVAKNGRLVSISALNYHSDAFDKVWMYQFFQDRPGHVTLFIVKRPEFDATAERKLLDTVREKLGENMSIETQYVNKLQRTGRGKFKLIEQRIDLNKSAFNEKG